MKKHFISVVTVSFACIFISGCLGSIVRKPPPPLQPSKEGVVLKVDNSGKITLVTKDGEPYTVCGGDQQPQCPPIAKGAPERLVGTISEVKVTSEVESIQPGFAPRSLSREQSSCDHVLKLVIDGETQYIVVSRCANND